MLPSRIIVSGIILLATAVALLVRALLRKRSDRQGNGDSNSGDKVAPLAEDFLNRRTYATLTPAILASISDDKLEQAIVDHIHLRGADQHDKTRRIFASLPAAFRMVYATWIMEGEVENGGFHQFFWNCSDRIADEALAGLRLLGASEYAGLMEKAMAMKVREEPLQLPFKKRNTIEAFCESYKYTDLEQVDTEFFNVKVGLSALRIRYIRAHPEEFRSP